MELPVKNNLSSAIPPRQDRRIEEHVHDPYMTRLKLHDPSSCPDCGVIFHNGRWQWPGETTPEAAHEQTCPACQRIRDDYPAGWLTISGGFARQHADEILHLVKHQEKAECQEHPMNRIMGITRENGAIVITTTDIHLPRRIGEAVHHAYQGELAFHYEDESYLLRVHWSRES
jgi:hypothetical protein